MSEFSFSLPNLMAYSGFVLIGMVIHVLFLSRKSAVVSFFSTELSMLVKGVVVIGCVAVAAYTFWIEYLEDYLDALPTKLIGLSLFSLLPTIATAYVCKLFKLCDPRIVVALLALPIGVLLSLQGLKPFMESLSADVVVTDSLLALLPAVIGGVTSTVFYTWPGSDFKRVRSVIPSLRLQLVVFAVLTTTVIGSSFAIAFTISRETLLIYNLLHIYSWVGLYSVIFLVLILNHGNDSLALRISNASLIAFGLGVAFSMLAYFAAYDDPEEVKQWSIVALIGMTYSAMLYIASVLWVIVRNQLQPKTFSLKNWHVAEMFTFWVFAVMSPPSLWEAVGAAEVEDAKMVKLENRIQELERRLQQ